MLVRTIPKAGVSTSSQGCLQSWRQKATQTTTEHTYVAKLIAMMLTAEL